jgi:trehalose 6-phosphate synthase
VTGQGKAEFVVVANRLPVDLEREPDGSDNWKRSPGGLVTALEPILRSRRGAWVGWPGLADAQADPFDDDGLELYPCLTSEDVENYYEASPTTRSGRSTTTSSSRRRTTGTGGRPYAGSTTVRRGRRRGRGRGCDGLGAGLPAQLVPGQLRERRPDLRIGFFLHIPFPPVELFLQLPWREQIIRGLLGADLVGFHTPGGARNFHTLSTRSPGAAAGTVASSTAVAT